jgi:hypothetical protein
MNWLKPGYGFAKARERAWHDELFAVQQTRRQRRTYTLRGKSRERLWKTRCIAALLTLRPREAGWRPVPRLALVLASSYDVFRLAAFFTTRR